LGELVLKPLLKKMVKTGTVYYFEANNAGFEKKYQINERDEG